MRRLLRIMLRVWALQSIAVGGQRLPDEKALVREAWRPSSFFASPFLGLDGNHVGSPAPGERFSRPFRSRQDEDGPEQALPKF